MPLATNPAEHAPAASPELAALPPLAAPRLIDDGLLHFEASAAGLIERYCSGQTSHTVHVWWARRPHSAMRALVFASLCKTRDPASLALLAKLCAVTQPEPHILATVQKLLESQYGGSPKVLDMFGGGGTIPWECLALGASAHSLDSNELSVFLQRCNLVYSQEAMPDDVSSFLHAAGTRVLKQLHKSTAPLFPSRHPDLSGVTSDSNITTYLWTYSTSCKKCHFRFYLTRRPWLSKKRGRNLGLRFLEDGNRQRLTIAQLDSSQRPPSAWVGRRRSVICPQCGHTWEKVSVADCRDELVADVWRTRQGKEFTAPTAASAPSPASIRTLEVEVLHALGIALPDSHLPKWSGIVNPALYGIETHADFLNPRQRLVLLLLLKALRDEYHSLLSQHPTHVAKYVIGQLSSLVDQLVDWNCRLSMWIPQNEQVGRAFCGPGVPMLWDYAETDPVMRGPSNLWKKLDRIAAGVQFVRQHNRPADVRHGHAQDLPFPDDSFDAVVTDPPYYDNIYYTVLADFFYAWKRILLAEIEPALFARPHTDASAELVASTFRNGSTEAAHSMYCDHLIRAVREAARVTTPSGVLSFIYGHSSFNGWEALVRAFRASPFVVTSVQPLSIERKHRPRAIGSVAVNTCIVFVARKSDTPKSLHAPDALATQVAAIRDGPFANHLAQAGWQDADIAMAVFAHGVGLLANSAACQDDIAAMAQLVGVVQQRFPAFKIARRASL